MQAQVMLPALLYYCLCENCHANTTTTQRSWLYRQIFHNNTITHTSYHLGLFHNLHQKVWKVFRSKTFMFLNTKFPFFFSLPQRDLTFTDLCPCMKNLYFPLSDGFTCWDWRDGQWRHFHVIWHFTQEMLVGKYFNTGIQNVFFYFLFYLNFVTLGLDFKKSWLKRAKIQLLLFFKLLFGCQVDDKLYTSVMKCTSCWLN